MQAQIILMGQLTENSRWYGANPRLQAIAILNKTRNPLTNLERDLIELRRRHLKQGYVRLEGDNQFCQDQSPAPLQAQQNRG